MELNYRVNDDGTLQPYVESGPEDLPLQLAKRRLSVWSIPCQDILKRTGLSQFLPPMVAISGRQVFYDDPQKVFVKQGGVHDSHSRSRSATEGGRTVSASQMRSLKRAWAALENMAKQDELAKELKDSLLVPCPSMCPEAWQARGKRLAVIWGLRPKGKRMVPLPEALRTLEKLKVVARSRAPWAVAALAALAALALVTLLWLPSAAGSSSPAAEFVLRPSEYCFVGQEVSADVTGSGLRDGSGKVTGESGKASFYIDWGDGAGFAGVAPPVCRHTYLTSGARTVRLKVVGPDDSNAVTERTVTVLKVVPVSRMQITPGLEVDRGAPVTVNTDGSGYSVNGDPNPLSLQQFRQKWPDLARGVDVLIDWGDDAQAPRPMEGRTEEHRYADANVYNVGLAVRVLTPNVLEDVQNQSVRVGPAPRNLARVDPTAQLTVAPHELNINEPVNVSIAGSGYRLNRNGQPGPLMDLSDLQRSDIAGRDNARITIDWGDGSGKESITTNKLPRQHKYTKADRYPIKLAVRGPGGQESVASDRVDVAEWVLDDFEPGPDGLVAIMKKKENDRSGGSDGDSSLHGQEGDGSGGPLANGSQGGNQGSGDLSSAGADNSQEKNQGGSQQKNEGGGDLSGTGADNPQKKSQGGATGTPSDRSPPKDDGVKRVPIPSDDTPPSKVADDWPAIQKQVIPATSKYTFIKERGELRIDYQLPKNVPMNEVSGWKYYLDDGRTDLTQTPVDEVVQVGKGFIVFRWSNADGKPGLLERIQSHSGSSVPLYVKATWTPPSGQKMWVLSQQSVTSEPETQTTPVPRVKDVQK